jgi:hypothetical protein
VGRLQWFPKTINASEIVNQVRHKFKMQNEGRQEAEARPSGRGFGLKLGIELGFDVSIGRADGSAEFGVREDKRSRAENGQILESMPFAGTCYHLSRYADAGSVPAPTTNT